MFKSLKQNFAPFLFATVAAGLLTFPIWSHFSQDKELKNQADKLNSVVIQGGDDLLVGASTLFAQNASVQLNLEVLGTYASVSGNLSFSGEIQPDGATCSNGQVLKRTGANNWDCAADASGSVASNSLDFDEFVASMSLDTWTDVTFGANQLSFNLDSTGDFVIQDNGTIHTIFTDAGNVGIGTTNPSTFKLQVAGSVGPSTDDGGALGASGTEWSDLFLNTGGVINWDAGDVTITQSTGILSLGAVSQVDFTAAGNKVALGDASQFAPTVNDSVTLGYGTLAWGDLFLAEGGIINWDNGDLTLTQTGNTLALAGGTLFDITGSASVSLNFEVGGYASVSGDLNFFSEIMPDGSICANNEILKKTGANNWDCAADATGATGSVASNSLNFDEFQNPLVLDTNITTTSASFQWDFGGTNFANMGSASFTRGFKIANSTGDNLFRITSGGVVNAGTWSGTALVDSAVSDAITISGGTIGANNISGLQTTTGTLTFGDNGDNIVFDSNTWDITGAGVGSGFTQFTVDNLDLNGNSFTSTTGGITIAPNSALTNFTGAASVSTNFEAIGYASASLFQGTAFGGIDCNDAGDQLLWSGGLFTCETLADADIPDDITITNLSGTNTGDVTLAGTPNYITLANQVLTLTKLDISDDTNATGGTGVDITANDFTFDATELEALTWGAGGNASNIWTFNLTSGDPTMTWTQSGASLSLNFEAIGYASASKYFGSAFYTSGTEIDCNDAGEGLQWSAGIYTCRTWADADIPDSITITNLSGTNTGDVTLAGTPNYITLANQVLTLTKLDISDDTNLTAGTDLTITANDLTLDSTLTQAFSFTNTGSQSFTGSVDVSKGLHALAAFTVTGSASFNGGVKGSGLTNCNGNGNALTWFSTGAKFGCKTLADADIPDTITIAGGTDIALADGGTGASLTDPNANRIFYWDDTAGTTDWLTADTAHFSIATDTLSITANGIDDTLIDWGTGANQVSIADLTGNQVSGALVWDFGGATSFEIVQNGTVNATGEITVNTTSNSFDWYNGSRVVVHKEETCFGYYIEDPTSANDKWIGHKRFNDPFTLTEVLPVASGSNAAGWNLRYGDPGSLTTSVFTNNKSASTSLPNIRYTSFANSTLTEGQVLDVVITSTSATLQSFSVNVCGRYNH